MLTIEERTACVADFETVFVDLNGGKNRMSFSVQVLPERRNDILDESEKTDKELVLYEPRVADDEGAVDNMLCFLVDTACGSTESCQPLESILKTSSKRMSNSEGGKLQDDAENRRSVEFKGVVIREFGLTLGRCIDHGHFCCSNI
mmetsp:Transcript_11480/g.27712  ORF Transcript_11480/g.27712 Transcript_11480/m.27712 type:complete len:146 (-) Transcript_11480:483-920(-)